MVIILIGISATIAALSLTGAVRNWFAYRQLEIEDEAKRERYLVYFWLSLLLTLGGSGLVLWLSLYRL